MANASHYTDGAKFRINLVNQGLTVYEKSVQPGGQEGGDPINITTNDNGTEMSFAPPYRSEPTPAVVVVTYDSTDKAALEAAVNVSDTIVTTYPDDTTEAAIGWLRSFVPESAEQGDQPTASVTFAFEGEAPA